MSATLVSVWQAARDALIAAGVDTPVLNSRLLLEAGAGVARLDIVTDPRRVLSNEQVAAVEALVARRVAREPVSHILGRKEFWTYEFTVTPGVLTPRPETEFVVELALWLLPPDQPARVLDLGVGSGAILMTVLAQRPLASGVGVDISVEAIEIARINAERLGVADRVELQLGDWTDGLVESFDLILANPPYIPVGDVDGLEPEVAVHEPRLALEGGADGLDAYRLIVPALPALLKRRGAFAFEVGRDQSAAVEAIAQAAGLAVEPPKLDLAGVPRVVWGRRPA